ncbi:hypothetical protein M0R72_03445 [Candidatus Pacearchaeota archaeon]|jgi:ABC-type thiamin/hydroxymethylpyrimidine transport system permease subunit|nr:hypothetical protein [Candidatus Pacearchaeota archaeon]
MVKKRVKKVSRKSARKSSPIVGKKRKISVLLNNLLLFIALALVSLVLKEFISEEYPFFIDLFFVLFIVFGFIAVAFLIVFLILLLVKALKK